LGINLEAGHDNLQGFDIVVLVVDNQDTLFGVVLWSNCLFLRAVTGIFTSQSIFFFNLLHHLFIGRAEKSVWHSVRDALASNF